MKQIKSKDTAVHFIGKDINGNKIDLNDYKGQKVLLTFFRVATCPFCNMAVRDLINGSEALEQKGIKVIALFSSTQEEKPIVVSIKRYFEKLLFRIFLFSDVSEN